MFQIFVISLMDKENTLRLNHFNRKKIISKRKKTGKILHPWICFIYVKKRATCESMNQWKKKWMVNPSLEIKSV